MIVISDKDEEEIKMYDVVCNIPKGLAMTKKETMMVDELDEKMAKQMNDKIT